MTAQILKQDTKQEFSHDPAFLIQWLNGNLSEEELSTMRNREEYQAMVSANQVDPVELPEKLLPVPGKDTGKQPTSESVALSKSSAFPTFAATAIVLFTVAMAYVKLNGWW